MTPCSYSWNISLWLFCTLENCVCRILAFSESSNLRESLSAGLLRRGDTPTLVFSFLLACAQKNLGLLLASAAMPFSNFLFSFRSKDFTFDAEIDTRIRHDYDLTLSELLGEHFLKTSKNFMEKQGLLHRTQTYGLNMDMMSIKSMIIIMLVVRIISMHSFRIGVEIWISFRNN